MPQSIYSVVQSPAIPFAATAMELLEVLKQVILASEGAFREIPVCARHKLVRQKVPFIWIREPAKRTLRSGLRYPPNSRGLSWQDEIRAYPRLFRAGVNSSLMAEKIGLPSKSAYTLAAMEFGTLGTAVTLM